MKKLTVMIHSLIAILLAVALYFYQPAFAISFLITSFVFNIYLRLLYKGFDLPVPGEEQASKISVLMALVSSLRLVLTAGIIAVLIVKFKLNLIAAGFAFLLYQLVLIAIGFYYNASHHGRNTR